MRSCGLAVASAVAAALSTTPGLVHGFVVLQRISHLGIHRYPLYNNNNNNNNNSNNLNTQRIRKPIPISLLAFEQQQQKQCQPSIQEEENSNTKISHPRNPFKRAYQKFQARPFTYLLIPCIAALVGWITNWMAVQMIFYPIEFWGIPIWRREEVPLALIGWQGIVPCKTKKMSRAMVHMVTSQLLSIKTVFARLDPNKAAQLLAPRVPLLVQEVTKDMIVPSAKAAAALVSGLPKAIFNGMDAAQQQTLRNLNFQFLTNLVKSMQANIEKVFSLENCVVSQMLQDREILGQLFRKCGQAELDFLTNSGLWFGFLLGIIQMIVALFWDNPWTLSIGGAIVGYATNWLALKWIFQPVEPTQFGPFVLQGLFLRRQAQVSVEFSKFFAQKILTGQRLWESVLTDPQTFPAFGVLFAKHFTDFLQKVSGTFRIGLSTETVSKLAHRALFKLPNHVHVLYPYMDQTLKLESTLCQKMKEMTSAQFERVLHPIFEEDELTLILAGAGLGLIAGLIQQGLETGAITLPAAPNLSSVPRSTVRRVDCILTEIVLFPGHVIMGTLFRSAGGVGHRGRGVNNKHVAAGSVVFPSESRGRNQADWAAKTLEANACTAVAASWDLINDVEEMMSLIATTKDRQQEKSRRLDVGLDDFLVHALQELGQNATLAGRAVRDVGSAVAQMKSDLVDLALAFGGNSTSGTQAVLVGLKDEAQKAIRLAQSVAKQADQVLALFQNLGELQLRQEQSDGADLVKSIRTRAKQASLAAEEVAKSVQLFQNSASPPQTAKAAQQSSSTAVPYRPYFYSARGRSVLRSVKNVLTGNIQGFISLVMCNRKENIVNGRSV